MFFNIKRFFKSLKCAGRGLISVYKTEQNFRFQIIIALIIIALMLVLGVTRKEAVLLILMIAKEKDRIGLMTSPGPATT